VATRGKEVLPVTLLTVSPANPESPAIKVTEGVMEFLAPQADQEGMARKAT